MYSALQQECEQHKLAALKSSSTLAVLQRRHQRISADNDRLSADVRRLKKMIPDKSSISPVVSIHGRRQASQRQLSAPKSPVDPASVAVSNQVLVASESSSLTSGPSQAVSVAESLSPDDSVC